VTALSGSPAPHWPEVLGRWHLEPVPVALVLSALVAYLRGRRRVGPGGRWDRRDTAFVAGLGTALVALVSPVGTYAEALLSVHMVQHLLLVLVAAPLLVGSRPVDRLLGFLPPALAAEVRRAGSGPVSRLLRHPLVAWVVFAATGWAVHFSPLFDLALRRPAVHGAEHALFLGSGLLFWAPVLAEEERRLSHPLRLLYLALAMPQNTFLALAISSAGSPLYETYTRLGRTWGPSPLADQRQAGGIMWVAGDIALLVAVLAVAGAWGGAEARRREEDEEDWPGPAGGSTAEGAPVSGPPVSGPPVSEGSAGPPPSPRTAG
jgi:putative copper resistance protein D